MGETDVQWPTFDCKFQLRNDPVRHQESVRIGCGAGFAGDRPSAALKLLQRVPNMDYLVLECLAERTLSNRYDAMASGGKGYDPRLSEWMRVLLPVALQHGVRIITNMGAIDPVGAQKEVLKTAASLGFRCTVSVAYEIQGTSVAKGSSTYLGAAPIVHLLETTMPDVIITSRTADAALFLAPMVYELGWNWDQFSELALGTLAGHLLECGCQLTGGYYMHPADRNRNLSFEQLREVSLPYADVSSNGEVVLAKPAGSGGELSMATCSQQLLYEIGDPAAYITPDVIVDFQDVTFIPVSEHEVLARGARPASGIQFPLQLLQLVPEFLGWKGWGEISYGGVCCQERAAAADFLVRAWMQEAGIATIDVKIASYLIGENSLGVIQAHQADHLRKAELPEVRLRMDGLFVSAAHAQTFTEEFGALYTNGPAGGGGISFYLCVVGYSFSGAFSILHVYLIHEPKVPREQVNWTAQSSSCVGKNTTASTVNSVKKSHASHDLSLRRSRKEDQRPAPGGVSMPLYQIAHGRTGDKGNHLNIGLIPHCRSDIDRLKVVIDPAWVLEALKEVLKPRNLIQVSENLNEASGSESGAVVEVDKATNSEEREGGVVVHIYHVRGIGALNLLITNVLDGGVTCSRRIDRHGKSLSDAILCQLVTLPVI